MLQSTALNPDHALLPNRKELTDPKYILRVQDSVPI